MAEEKPQKTAEEIADMITEALEDKAEIEVYEWPFPQDAGGTEFKFYVETENPHQRFSISIKEFYAFRSGIAYF